MYLHASQLADLVDIAVVSQSQLFADKAYKYLIAGGLMHASARENARPNVKFVTRAD